MDGKALKKILDPWPEDHIIHRGLLNLMLSLEYQYECQRKERMNIGSLKLNWRKCVGKRTENNTKKAIV